MRLHPFIVGPERADPRMVLLGATGIAWGPPTGDAPRGRIGLWLWRSNHLHRRTRKGSEIIEHYRFASYGLEFEVGSRRFYFKWA